METRESTDASGTRRGEIALLVEALDSHEYWQLSESHERNSGYSTVEDGE